MSGSPITVLRSNEHLTLAKSFTAWPDGEISSTDYPHAKWFRVQTGEIDGIRQLSEVLVHLEGERDACVIRGAPAEDTNLAHTARRSLPRDDEPATFVDVEGGLRWALVDVDKLQLPIGTTTDSYDAVVEYALSLLPSWLQGVTCHVQLSSSYGVRAKDVASLHLWFWLDRPVTDAEWIAHAEAWNAVAGWKCIDPALFRTVQVHYTAAPVFRRAVGTDGADEEDMEDPLPRRSWLHEGDVDEATVPRVAVPPERPAKHDKPLVPGGDAGIARAIRYLATREGAVQGAGGDDATFRAIVQGPIGHGVSEDRALEVMGAWNARCAPPWEREELADKIHRAYRDAKARPGYMLDEGERFKLTELGNAERFVAEHGQDVRYVLRRGIWRIYEGGRWVDDDQENTLVMGWMAQCARKASIEAQAELDALGPAADDETCDADKARRAAVRARLAWAHKSESSSNMKGSLTLARSLPGVATVIADYDRDPMLLNCPNGTVDLRTGQLRPHDRADMLTRMTGRAYHRGASHLVWTRYLRDATGGDVELLKYIQKWGGYAATGRVSEKAFAFLYGPTNTAKSTFLVALSAALGSYAVNADASTWLVQSFTGGNRGDLVKLQGARLVYTAEFRKGARFDEGVLKRVTGGDAITAADKYEKSIEFVPVCKILLAANDAPKFDGVDDAIMDRCHRIPFTHLIAREARDPKVIEDLRDDEVCGEAVLAWIVAGCVAWQREGLERPTVVQESTDAYRLENEPVARFLAERCTPDQTAKTTRGGLREAFDLWAERERIDNRLTDREFTSRVREAGIAETWLRSTRGWAVTIHEVPHEDLTSSERWKMTLLRGPANRAN